jgi:hypothetical protein
MSISSCSIANTSQPIYFKNINSEHESFLSSLKCLWVGDIFTQRSYFWHSKIAFLPAGKKDSLTTY